MLGFDPRIPNQPVQIKGRRGVTTWKVKQSGTRTYVQVQFGPHEKSFIFVEDEALFMRSKLNLHIGPRTTLFNLPSGYAAPSFYLKVFDCVAFTSFGITFIAKLNKNRSTLPAPNDRR